ncbi:MAG: glycosyltransferase family 39 protein [Pyrinomonadaceae bacterium]
MNADKNRSEIGEISQIEGTDRLWFACAVLVTAVAAFLRFFWLDLKPLHHDEGVNGFFLTNLVRDGIYKYDPGNYHGPTLYYIALPFVELFGLKTIPIRVSVAIFGVLTVILALFLKRYIGKTGSIFAALFLALSPGMVYISRYFIHEIFFIFLSLAIVVAVLLFIERRKAGYFAIGWMVLLLLVCFLPSALNLASFLGGENQSALWAFRIAFLVIESALVYLVIRMILAWNEGRLIYLMLASASAALLFATKETAFITIGTMAIACACVWGWRRFASSESFDRLKWPMIGAVHVIGLLAALYFRNYLVDGAKWVYDNFLGQGRVQEPFVFYMVILLTLAAISAWAVFLYFYRQSDAGTLDEDSDLTWSNLALGIGTGTDRILLLAAIVTVFIYITVLFFSSFFTYGEGVSKAFEAYSIWTKTGSKDHTQNGVFAYIKWGVKVETPLLVLSALGAGIALLRVKHRFAIFTAFWAFGLFAAYMIIPYKTPWLALSFYLPMCIIAGYGINELVASKNLASKISGIVLAAFATVLLGYQTYDLNFVRYDDEEMGYVYAHTKRPLLGLVAKIEYYAGKSGKGKDATIEIVSPDYWPMTWYLNEYGHANFHGQLVDANTSEMIVAKKNDQDGAVIQKYSAHYKFVDVWPLRPGVDLMLLVRKDLADSDAKELYKILEYESPEIRR